MTSLKGILLLNPKYRPYFNLKKCFKGYCTPLKL